MDRYASTIRGRPSGFLRRLGDFGGGQSLVVAMRFDHQQIRRRSGRLGHLHLLKLIAEPPHGTFNRWAHPAARHGIIAPGVARLVSCTEPNTAAATKQVGNGRLKRRCDLQRSLACATVAARALPSGIRRRTPPCPGGVGMAPRASWITPAAHSRPILSRASGAANYRSVCANNSSLLLFFFFAALLGSPSLIVLPRGSSSCASSRRPMRPAVARQLGIGGRHIVLLGNVGRQVEQLGASIRLVWHSFQSPPRMAHVLHRCARYRSRAAGFALFAAQIRQQVHAIELPEADRSAVGGGHGRWA